MRHNSQKLLTWSAVNRIKVDDDLVTLWLEFPKKKEKYID